MRSLIAFLLLASLLWSCTGKEPPPPKPNYVLPDDSLAMVLAEMHLYTAIFQHRTVRRNRLKDYARRDLQLALDSMGVSRARVDSSLRYYKTQPTHLEGVYDEALNILSTQLAEQKALEAKNKQKDSLKLEEGSAEQTMKEILEADGQVLFGKKFPLNASDSAPEVTEKKAGKLP